ncbi:MAG: Asp-tRNA(Asn)/Glu-tRNA(Gln) amidotransferase subunit GatC [Terriglobales bacterium]
MQLKLAEVAALAQLDLTPAEAAALERDLAAVLDYVAQLDQIDTAGVAPMSHPLVAHAPLRDDLVRPWLSTAEAVANATEAVSGMFAVPKILERG